MKPASHDPLDDMMMAALHGELTPEERAVLNQRLQNDPAARAAYQETQLMHDLLEKTHREAQPDPNFEQRMISGVRRKIDHEAHHRETPWESVLVLWMGIKALINGSRIQRYATVCVLGLFLAIVLFLGRFAAMHSAFHALAMANSGIANPSPKVFVAVELKKKDARNEMVDGLEEAPQQYRAGLPAQTQEHAPAEKQAMAEGKQPASSDMAAPIAAPMAPNAANNSASLAQSAISIDESQAARGYASPAGSFRANHAVASTTPAQTSNSATAWDQDFKKRDALSTATDSSPTENRDKLIFKADNTERVPAPTTAPAPTDNRKLIRNAQLDLQVANYQKAIDTLGDLARAAGGYVDSSNSQRGANGRLQGSMVVKVLPQNLDAFLLKLRGLGDVLNQALSTEDVTKEYTDTLARLDNARRMETQLQELLKRDNGKVSELLQVERELGRVRGNIEQMQGELKLYDFQVAYATVTLSIQERELDYAAIYMLRESDQFSLFAIDVEKSFQQAKQVADQFKAHIVTANLNHNSGSDVSATLELTVPPEQIDAFIEHIHPLGRVENFTRQTRQEMVRGGTEADSTGNKAITEHDRVNVDISIRSDTQSQKQAALTVVTPAVDDALEQAKAAVLASAGGEILASSLNKTPDGPSTASLNARVPGRGYAELLKAFRALGRTSAFSLQRDDNSGPNASGDETPVVISLSLTNDESPLQRTDLAVSTSNVDAKAQQLKNEAATDGVEIRTSGFDRQPDGTETAQMTFRLPMAGYPAFLEKLKSLGRVESLTVHREDRPDQARADDQAPAEIGFRLYSEGKIVSNDNGLWAALRRTFGQGAQALFSSITIIGVVVAFLAPWLLCLALLASTSNVDAKAQQLKNEAATDGVEIRTSGFDRQPDGTETAQMTFRLPMAGYPAFLEKLKSLGRVESLTVHREDRPDQARADDQAPAEIGFRLYSEGKIVSNDNGLWAALRRTFGQGAQALFSSITIIGVVVAFLAPWLLCLALLAWVARRIYIARRR